MKTKMVTIGEIAEIRAGVGFPTRLQGRQVGRYPFAKVGDISIAARLGEPLFRARNYVDEDLLQELGARPFPANSIVFAKIGEAISQNFRVLTSCDVILDNNAMGIICDLEKVVPAFLLHYLRTVDFYPLAGKTSVPAIRKSSIEALTVPLPTIQVQTQVATILDRADAIRRKRQEAITLTDQLLRSTFLEMFGDPVTNPKRWPLVELRGHIIGMDAGWSANSEPRVRQGDEWGVLKVSAVSSGRFRPDEHKAVLSIDDTSSLIVPKRGDLLFSRANTRELVAATCLVEDDQSRLFLPDKLWRIRTNPSSLTPEYLRSVLSNPEVQASLAKVATGTSGSMLNISKEKVADFKVPLPPLQHQLLFARHVWLMLALRSKAALAARDATNLFSSLVQRAFTGQL